MRHIAPFASLLFALTACGGDSSSSTSDAGRLDSGASDASQSGDSSTNTGDSSTAVMCTEEQRTYLTEHRDTVQMAGAMCGLSPTLETFQTCFDAQTNNELAGGCNSCVYQRARCTIGDGGANSCISKCSGAQATPEMCLACQCEHNCPQEFDSCSGQNSAAQCPSGA